MPTPQRTAPAPPNPQGKGTPNSKRHTTPSPERQELLKTKSKKHLGRKMKRAPKGGQNLSKSALFKARM